MTKGGVRVEGNKYWEPTALHLWYDELARFMIANPHMKKKDVARHFNKAPQTVYLVTNSDTFKQYYRERMDHMHGANVSIAEKQAAVTEAALDHLLEDLTGSSAEMKLNPMELKEIANDGMKALGYGIPKGPPAAPSVAIQFNISKGEIEEARKLLLEKHGVQAQLPAPGE
jgi:hypothetical protein